MKKNEYIIILLIIIIINIDLCLSLYTIYTIEINKNETNLGLMSIKFNDYCKEWIPSYFHI